MNLPASVEGRERLRLFLALRLPDEVLDALVAWQHTVLSGGRLVPRQSLHITLAFLGSRPVHEVDPIVAELRDAAARAERPLLAVERYRETRSVGMLVLRDDGGRATRLADDVQTRLAQLGVYERERRPWLPHVTVLRFRQPPRARPALPELGPVAPSEAAAYLSVLRPGGAQYEILESVALGG